MRLSARRLVPAVLAATALLAVPAGASAAELFYAVTPKNQLLKFGSDAPAALGGGQQIYGLAAGERVLDLDLRPRTDELYAVTSASRVYRINPGSGRAVAVGTGPFSPVLGSAGLGADFDGAADRLRLVDDADQNVALNPNDGTGAADAPLAYASDDPKAGVNPHVVANAFTNNVAQAATNDQYGIDNVQRTLVRQDPADPSTLRTVAPLTIRGRALPVITGPVGFDVAANGVAYASFRFGAHEPALLYRVNLATGALSIIGPIGPLSAAVVTTGLAAAGFVPADRRAPVVVAAAPETQRLSNVVTRGLRFELSCNETCIAIASLRIRDNVLARSALVLPTAGKGNLRFRLTSKAARSIVRSRFRRITLRLVVTDGAGNVREQSENVTLVP